LGGGGGRRGTPARDFFNYVRNVYDRSHDGFPLCNRPR